MSAPTFTDERPCRAGWRRRQSLTSVPWRWLLAAGWLAAGLFLYRQVFSGLVEAWRDNPSYSHGWFVIPLAGWLLWRRRGERPRPWQPSLVGLALIAAAHSAWWLGESLHFPAATRWSLPVWAAGLAATLGGREALRWAAPAIGFLGFMIPLPFALETLANQSLQAASADLSAQLLAWTGTFAVSHGSALMLPGGRVEITAACSGMRTTLAIAAFGYLILFAKNRPVRTRLTVAGCVLPAAILANAIRIAAVAVAIDRFDAPEPADRIHDAGDWLMVPVAVGLLVAAAVVCRWWVGQLAGLLGEVALRRVPERSEFWIASRLARTAAAIALPAVLTLGVITTRSLHRDERQDFVAAGIASAEDACAQGRWELAASRYGELVAWFPDSIELRLRHAQAGDESARTRQEQEQTLLRYAAILEQVPYHPAALRGHLDKALRLGLAGPALASARRLYSVDRNDLISLQMHAEATLRFLPSGAEVLPFRSEDLEHLLRRSERAGVCRDSFVLAVAAFACRESTQLGESIRPDLFRAVRGLTERLDTAETHFLLWRMRQRWEDRQDDRSLAIAVARSRAGIGDRQWRGEILLAAASEASRRGRWQEASRLLGQAARVEPKDLRVAWLRGDLAWQLGQPERAVACYRAAWQRGGQAHPVLGIRLAEAYAELGELDAASQLVRRLLAGVEAAAIDRIDRDRLWNRLTMLSARLAMAQRDDQRALELLADVRVVGSWQAPTASQRRQRRLRRRYEAECLVRLGRFAEAARRFERLAVAGPDEATWWLSAARAWAAEGEAAASLDAYRQAVQASGELSAVWVEYVAHLRRFRSLEEAVGEIGWRAKQSGQGNHLDLQRLAEAWELVGRDDRAEACYRAAAEADPSRRPPLAIHLARTGRVEEAVRLVDDADWEVPVPTRAHTAAVVGVCSGSLSAGDRRRLERIIRQGLAVAPRDVPMLIAIADWYGKEGFVASAGKIYRDVLALEPGQPVAANNLAMLLADQPRTRSMALQEIDALIARAGPAPEYLDTKAWVLLQMGRPQEAIALLGGALRGVKAEVGLSRFHLAVAYWAAGDAGRAREVWREAGCERMDLSALQPGQREAWRQLRSQLERAARVDSGDARRAATRGSAEEDLR